MLAIEVYLDADADTAVRRIWSGLDVRGITSLGSVPDTEYRPHVTLAVYRDTDTMQVAQAVRPGVTDCLGIPLTLASVGFFVTAESPAFLAVAPTEQLLAVHRSVHEALSGLRLDVWPRYEPGSFLPHCTLAMGSRDAVAIAGAVEEVGLPIEARAQAVHIVQIATGRSRLRLA